MTEGHALGDAIRIRRMHQRCPAQAATTFGALGLAKMTAARAGAQDLAAGGDLEPLGRGFLSFNTFRASHKFFLSEKSANYRYRTGAAQEGISTNQVNRHLRVTFPLRRAS